MAQITKCMADHGMSNSGISLVSKLNWSSSRTPYRRYVTEMKKKTKAQKRFHCPHSTHCD